MAKRSFIDMINSKSKIASDYLPKSTVEPKNLQEITDNKDHNNEKNLTTLQNTEINQIDQCDQKITTKDQIDQPNLILDQLDHSQTLNNSKTLEKNNTNNVLVVDHQSSELTTKSSPVNHQVNHHYDTPVNHQINHQSNNVVNHQKEYTVNHQNYSVVNYNSNRSQDRHSKTRNLLGVRLANEFINEVKDFCKHKNLLLQDVVELALRDYMEKVVNHQNTNELTTLVVNQLTHDDHLMIYKTHDDIIMLYRKLTNKKWSAADDRIAYKMNDVDLKIIEIGMIHTFIQAKGKKINSFAYFVPEIKNVIDVKFDKQNLNVYLKSRRKLLNDFLIKLGKEPLSYTIKDKE